MTSIKPLLSILLGFVLGGSAWAQTRSPGPWRVAYSWERVERSLVWDWSLVAPADTGAPDMRQNRPRPDTATVRRRRRMVLPVAWNVDPATVLLLRNCENPLAAPSASKGIRFTVTGATLKTDQQGRRLLLSPAGTAVVLRAYRGQRELFAHAFEVADAPLPGIKCFYSGAREEYQCKPAGLGVTATVTFRAISDPDFTAVMPEKAPCRVAQAQLSLWRQGKLLQTTTINGPTASLGDWYRTSQPGDSLRAEVLRVQRRNSQGAIESKPLQRKFQMLYRRE